MRGDIAPVLIANSVWLGDASPLLKLTAGALVLPDIVYPGYSSLFASTASKPSEEVAADYLEFLYGSLPCEYADADTVQNMASRLAARLETGQRQKARSTDWKGAEKPES